MKRAVFALVATAVTLSGCYIEDGEMKVTPNNVKLDYKEHQLQLTTDQPIATMGIWIDDIYIGNSQFSIERNVAVYDGGWINVILPLPRSDGRNLYIQCNENRSSEPRQCKIRIRNLVGSDYATLTQAGRPNSIGISDDDYPKRASQ